MKNRSKKIKTNSTFRKARRRRPLDQNLKSHQFPPLFFSLICSWLQRHVSFYWVSFRVATFHDDDDDTRSAPREKQSSRKKNVLCSFCAVNTRKLTKKFYLSSARVTLDQNSRLVNITVSMSLVKFFCIKKEFYCK